MGDRSEEGAVLAVNQAFYDAITARDLAAMDRLWARTGAVACAHPGWPPLFGRTAVMESWGGILGNPESPKIRCLEPRALMLGTLALVLCYELIEREVLLASNLFIAE